MRHLTNKPGRGRLLLADPQEAWKRLPGVERGYKGAETPAPRTAIAVAPQFPRGRLQGVSTKREWGIVPYRITLSRRLFSSS